jgi:hypothetical protein
MKEKLRLLKIILSWTAVLSGFGISVFGLGALGNWDLSRDLEVSWQWYGMGALLLLGIIPLAASLLAFRTRKVSYLLYLSTTPILVLCSWGFLRDVPGHLVRATALTSSPFLVLGLFWLFAQEYNWPRIALLPDSPAGRRIVVLVATGFLFCVAIFLTSVHLAVSSENPGDCGEGPPFADALHSRGAVFTARIVHVDPILGPVAVVQERFWGLPRWARIVLLKWGRVGDEFFVDGRPAEGLLTGHIVPVLDMKCTGSAFLKDAKVELRLLRDSPHWNGVRIIGRAVERAHGAPPIAGAKVIIAGPSGEVTVATDADGIYDVTGLPPGRYSVHATIYDEGFREYPACREDREAPELQAGDVWGCTLRIFQASRGAAPTASPSPSPPHAAPPAPKTPW